MDVEDVIAHAVYDPVARRQRYLKTRQLKGRQKGGLPLPPTAGVGSRIVDATAPQSRRHVSATQAMQAASAARQVAAIRGRLNALKAHLNELLAKQKAASSSSTKKSSTAKKTAATKTDNKPKTAKQKQAAKEAIKKAQKARAKNAPTKSAPSLAEQITQTRAVIHEVETKLRAAIQSARTQTASNGR